jgi:hypothetical protein
MSGILDLLGDLWAEFWIDFGGLCEDYRMEIVSGDFKWQELE